MKKIWTGILIIFLSQSCANFHGTYRDSEIELGTSSSLKIRPWGKFKYKWRAGLIKGTTKGNWERIGDTLILNSKYQPEDSIKIRKRKHARYRCLTDRKYLIDNNKIYWKQNSDQNFDTCCYYIKKK